MESHICLITLDVNLKPLHIVIALWVAFAATAEAGSLRYSKSKPVVFGIDMDYPPLEYLDDGGTPRGYDIKFTEEVMRRMGLSYTYRPNSWENIADDVLNGDVDLGMMVYSPYREHLTNYSRAVFRLYYQIVYRKGERAGRFDMRSLKDKEVAYMASRPLADTLTAIGAKLFEIKDLAAAMQALSAGEYDGVICFRYQSKYIIDTYQLTNLTTNDLTLTPREYCYVSHDRQLIDSINVILQEMEDEGLVDELYGVDITSSFGAFRIPHWFWYLIFLVVFLAMVLFIIVQQRYQKKMRIEMDRAQRSEKLKNVILGNISHSLRTPLNAIIGFSEVLDAEITSMPIDNQRKLLRLINSNGNQLLYFIKELLELSEIETDSKPLKRVEIPLRYTMRTLLDECRPDVEKEVELRLEGDDITVEANDRYMSMVTKHLLSNAVMHTHKGSITLRYFMVDKGLRIEVQDTGEGLPEALRDNIFALLAEKNTFIREDVPGLGLTICKAIVDRCHGRIGVESPKEGGTVFWHWVPVKRVN